MDIPGPEENDSYDDPNYLKPNASKRFYTVLQYYCQTTPEEHDCKEKRNEMKSNINYCSNICREVITKQKQAEKDSSY